jgi:phosphoglycolate phosphatase
MSFRAVLFDLDGTLLDTIADLSGSMNAVLSRAGFPVHPVDAYKYFVGDGLKQLVIRALPEESRDAETVRRIHEAMRAEYELHSHDRTRPYDGIPEMLSDLRRMEIPLAVLSNKPHAATLDVISHYFGDGVFRLVSGAKPDVPVKPDPQGALAVVREFGIPAGDFLYLGDTNTDMKTAIGAGMFPVGALWGFRTREELLGSGAKTVVAHPSEVPPLIRR